MSSDDRAAELARTDRRNVDRRSELARTDRRNVDRRSELARTEGRNPVLPGLESYIRSIPDFPKQGIVFRDITPLLASAEGLDAAVRGLADAARDLRPEIIIGPEARGFLFGPALARELGAGFALARKPGSLPHDTISADYSLEYGADSLELHADAFGAGARVLIHDDLLATGGTASALCRLVEQLDAEVVGFSFLIELAFLGGRERLAPRDVRALISYDAE